MTFRDLATVVAVVLSVVAFFRSRRLDKRDLFLKIHENLLAEIPMRGRRVLGKIRDHPTAKAVAHDEEKSTAVYRTLAEFDVLGLFVERGWVSERTVLEEWANSLSKYLEPKRHWVAHRYPDKDPATYWPHYDDLAERATMYLVEQYKPTRPALWKRQAHGLWKRRPKWMKRHRR